MSTFPLAEIERLWSITEPPRDKTNNVVVRPVRSESSLSAWRKLGSLATNWAHCEDSDQTGWMPRLIWVFAGHTATLLVLTWGGSIVAFPGCLLSSFFISPKHEITSEPPRDKTNNVAVRPAKTQISLGISPVWSESSLSSKWVAKGPSFLHADSEDSDQTGRMPRLIWVFAGRALTLLVLSRGSSNNKIQNTQDIKHKQK